MLTFLSLFAFSPSDISPGNWECPISGHWSVLNFRHQCPWGCREVSEPLLDSWLLDKLENFLVWPGLMKITFVSLFGDISWFTKGTWFKSYWNKSNIFKGCAKFIHIWFLGGYSFRLVLFVICHCVSSQLCTLNEKGILWLLLVIDVTGSYLLLVQVEESSKCAQADEAQHVSFTASPHQLQPKKDSSEQNPNYNYHPRFLSFKATRMPLQSTGMFVLESYTRNW